MVRDFGVAPFKRGNGCRIGPRVAGAGRNRPWTGARRLVPGASRLACPLRFTNVIESSYADDPLSIGSDAVDQATMAAILAAVGRNSLNEKEVLRSARVPAIVAPLHFAAFASSVKGAPGD